MTHRKATKVQYSQLIASRYDQVTALRLEQLIAFSKTTQMYSEETIDPICKKL